jgi:predicted esterase
MAGTSKWQDYNGFNYRLFPAKTEKPTSLIVYLHGVNGNAELPANYLRTLQEKIPGAEVIALQAPIKVIKSPRFEKPEGYSWFPFGGSILSQIETWFTHLFKRMTIADQIEEFTKDQLAKRGLTEDNLAYYGYSMGGIVALQTGLSGEKPVAAIVSRGGAFVPFSRVKNKSEVFLQMGENDEKFNTPAPLPEKGFLKRIFAEVVSLRHERSVQRLKGHHVPVTEKVYPQQGHEQNLSAWKEAVDFMAKALAKPQTSPTAPGI